MGVLPDVADRRADLGIGDGDAVGGLPLHHTDRGHRDDSRYDLFAFEHPIEKIRGLVTNSAPGMATLDLAEAGHVGPLDNADDAARWLVVHPRAEPSESATHGGLLRATSRLCLRIYTAEARVRKTRGQLRDS